MTKYVYTQPIPTWSPSRQGVAANRRTAGQAVLSGSGGATAQSTGLQPGERRLEGQYLGTDADLLAQEIRELADAPDIDEVPVHDDASTSDWEGYYVVENADVNPAQPQAEEELQSFDLRLKKAGSRRTHWREVKTKKNQRTNDFGSDSTTEIGIPAAATLVRWWDGDSQVEYPSASSTVAGEQASVELYDVDAASYSEPTLIYDLSYADDWKTDVVVWDTRNNANKKDADGDVQWGRVFDPAHEFAGDVVLSSRIVRITIDEANNTISAEDWDSGTSSWTSVSLGTSDWEPLDVDVRTIAPDRIEARVLFKDSVGGSKYPLDMILCRGDTDALWVRTPNATSATPSGLQTLLSPIAQTTDYDARETQGLAKREEVEQ